MKIHVLGNRVLMQRVSAETAKSGILLVETSVKEKDEGIVVGVGNLVETIKIGDHVLFEKYSANSFERDDSTYLIANEDKIMAILE